MALIDLLLYSLQLLPWIIHVYIVLHRFDVWNCTYVFIICDEILMCSEHLFHHMDCSSTYRNDVYIPTFQGILLVT